MCISIYIYLCIGAREHNICSQDHFQAQDEQGVVRSQERGAWGVANVCPRLAADEAPGERKRTTRHDPGSDHHGSAREADGARWAPAQPAKRTRRRPAYEGQQSCPLESAALGCRYTL